MCDVDDEQTPRGPIPHSLRNDVLTNPDLLQRVLTAPGDEVDMKRACAFVQKFCTVARCNADTWELFHEFMRIPYPKPEDVQWRDWIKSWCQLADTRQGTKAFAPALVELNRNLWWEGSGQFSKVDLKKVEWLLKYCIDTNDCDYEYAFRTTLLKGLINNGNFGLISRKSTENVGRLNADSKFPLIRLLEKYSPPLVRFTPCHAPLKWAQSNAASAWSKFYIALLEIPPESFEQCAKVCQLITTSKVFEALYKLPVPTMETWENSRGFKYWRAALLSALSQRGAMYFQPDVLEKVLAIEDALEDKIPVEYVRGMWLTALEFAQAAGQTEAEDWIRVHARGFLEGEAAVRNNFPIIVHLFEFVPAVARAD